MPRGAVELRKDEFAVAVVLGACGLRLRVCARIGSSAAACTRRRRRLCCCRLISAVVVLYEVLVHLLELAERWGNPGGWILEVVARQPDLLSRAGKGAQEGNKPGVRRVRGRASCDGVVGNAKSALVVRLVKAHVHPSAVLLVACLVGIPSALLQERIDDLVVNVLLEHVLVRELHMAINVLQPGPLAEAEEDNG